MTRGDPEADREVTHPVVCQIPENGQIPGNGRRALFLNPVYTQRFRSMTAEESQPLLDYLQQEATRPELTFRLQWRPRHLGPLGQPSDAASRGERL